MCCGRKMRISKLLPCLHSHLVQSVRCYNFGSTAVVNQISGFHYVRDPRLNKGTGFTLNERQHLTIQGLLPARVRTLDTQVVLAYRQIMHYKEPLDRYLYLQDLQERHSKLFFNVINAHIEKIMPLVYTPTVGLACQEYGKIFRGPKGLFITAMDKGHINHIFKNWPEHAIRAICVTDGARILGLGDLGCNGMGICVGKMVLYTALAGIEPHLCLPVMLDVGTDNEKLMMDPYYMGLRMNRIKGDEYNEFIDEFMQAATERYGPNIMIHFEDFAFGNALRLLDKYRPNYCIFNDDIQGTGAIGVAGIYSAAYVLKKKVSDLRFLFVGAGGANMGICTLLVRALEMDGLSADEAYKHIYIQDMHGLLTKDRDYDMEVFKRFAKDEKPVKDLLSTIKQIKPSVLIGATAQTGLFTPEILKTMGEINERPVVFALSNPTSKAECTSEQVYSNTEGRCLFCSGSPMPPVEYNGKVYHTSQMNNAYIYPGIALGAIKAEAHRISTDMFILAAKEVVKFVGDDLLDQGLLFPPLDQVNELSVKIAASLSKYAFCHNLAGLYPEPEDHEEYIRNNRYNFKYADMRAPLWTWKDLPDVDPNTINMDVPK